MSSSGIAGGVVAASHRQRSQTSGQAMPADEDLQGPLPCSVHTEPTRLGRLFPSTRRHSAEPLRSRSALPLLLQDELLALNRGDNLVLAEQPPAVHEAVTIHG